MQALRATVNLPPIVLATEFERHVSEYLNLIHSLREIIEKLEITRSFLLPRFLSGEIDLGGAERAAAKAAAE